MKAWRLLALLPVVLAGGCGDGTRTCTLIGGDSGVTLRWETADFAGRAQDGSGTLRLRACAGEVCEERSVAANDPDPLPWMSVELDEDIGEVTVPVRFTITADGEELFDDRAEVKLRKSTPNGEGCSPTLYQGGLTADPERGLVAG
ncbi:hypothetical protein [Streptomyces indicus]|uniref:Lipoprotein n=1 Tax=Streptomyces indicus TaxID=417292 RepID=A0A1G8ZPV9_9ACTN|nr:hypothetical protein [Streptomyces indicus]SDK16375.1 hypothetical protein SAMN05421806_10585 [Streptomyces indicus]